MRVCDIEECDSKHWARGFCIKHYGRWERHGDPLYVQKQKITNPLEALEVRTEPGPNGCILWAGAIAGNGYGQMWFEGRNQHSHRVVWTMVNGRIPKGLQVNHLCWVPRCVNIDHLELTSPSENSSYKSGPIATNTSGHRNVTWHKRDKKWQVTVTRGGNSHHFGYFNDLAEAASVAEKARQELFGEFAGKG